MQKHGPGLVLIPCIRLSHSLVARGAFSSEVRSQDERGLASRGNTFLIRACIAIVRGDAVPSASK
jgi:hypothetical protein